MRVESVLVAAGAVLLTCCGTESPTTSVGAPGTSGIPGVGGAKSISSAPSQGGAFSTTNRSETKRAQATSAGGASQRAPAEGGVSALPTGGKTGNTSTAGDTFPRGGAGAGATTGGTSSTAANGGTAGGGVTVTTATGSPSPGCNKTRTLQDGNQTITSGGTSRKYYLKTPSKYDNTHPYRLIFMFHWNYGSINSVVNPPDSDHNTDLPFYGLNDLAGDSSVFVVPQGITDNGGGAGWANPNNRDVNFTDDMLAAITADLCIDTSRVFTTGFSYGGAISYKLACVRADKFRAAVVYDTGPVSGNNSAECTKPIAFFQSHGMDDQTFNYSQMALPILNTFAKVNGCTALTPPTPPQNGHTCTSLEGCSTGHPVRFCNFGAGENNPHNTSIKGHYPSAKDPGQTVSWVPAEAWDFIKQF